MTILMLALVAGCGFKAPVEEQAVEEPEEAPTDTGEEVDTLEEDIAGIDDLEGDLDLSELDSLEDDLDF